MIKDSFIGVLRKEVEKLGLSKDDAPQSEGRFQRGQRMALISAKIAVIESLIQLSKRYRLDGIVISRECATDAIDEFREELAREETSRDRIADKSSKFWKKYEFRAKYWRDKITEIIAALENGK